MKASHFLPNLDVFEPIWFTKCAFCPVIIFEQIKIQQIAHILFFTTDLIPSNVGKYEGRVEFFRNKIRIYPAQTKYSGGQIVTSFLQEI